MPTSAASAPFAAVDLGSNSFHLIVAQMQNGQLLVIDRLRETVRLAAGLDTTGHLSQESQVQALACLQRFGQRLRALPEANIRAVGTNTFRVARDSAAFLAAAEQALGHPIEIIAGIEEARLIYSGVIQSLPEPNRRRLVIDIGGGSTELIIGERGSPLKLASLFVGCVTLSEQQFAKGIITRRALATAELLAAQELEPIFAEYCALGWEEAIGASGTLKAVESICRASGWSEGGIHRKALDKLKEQMILAGHHSRFTFPGMPENRAAVLAGGVAILSALFDILGLKLVRISEGALREGLLHDLVGRIRHEDIRNQSILALVQRFRVDIVQAQRVATTAQDLLAAVASLWALETEESQFLRWAAQLHEIGLNIAFNRYHKHGAYIVGHADLGGFSLQEQQFLALLIRAHRRSFPVQEWTALPERWQNLGLRLAALLRLAVILNRSRSASQVPELKVFPTRKGLKLEFPASWLPQHPLTQADLVAEASYLQTLNFSLKFA